MERWGAGTRSSDLIEKASRLRRQISAGKNHLTQLRILSVATFVLKRGGSVAGCCWSDLRGYVIILCSYSWLCRSGYNVPRNPGKDKCYFLSNKTMLSIAFFFFFKLKVILCSMLRPVVNENQTTKLWLENTNMFGKLNQTFVNNLWVKEWITRKLVN